MQVGQSWKIALSALKKNKLQTALTMIGMTIGVATVLTMISVGTGAEAAIHDQVLAAGMNLLVIHSGNFETNDELEDTGGAGDGPVAYDPLLDRPALVRVQSDGVAVDPNEDFKHKRGYQRPGDLMPGRGAAHTLTREDAEVLRRIRGVQYVSSGVRDSTMVANGETKHFAALPGDDVRE